MGIGILVPIGLAASDLIDRILTIPNKARHSIQFVLVLVFIALGFVLLIAINQFVTWLRDNKSRRVTKDASVKRPMADT